MLRTTSTSSTAIGTARGIQWITPMQPSCLPRSLLRVLQNITKALKASYSQGLRSKQFAVHTAPNTTRKDQHSGITLRIRPNDRRCEILCTSDQHASRACSCHVNSVESKLVWLSENKVVMVQLVVLGESADSVLTWSTKGNHLAKMQECGW
jgi:hypothetical protein